MADSAEEDVTTSPGVDSENVNSDVIDSDELGGVIIDDLDESTPPERNVRELSNVLTTLHAEDKVELEFGTDAATVERTATIRRSLGGRDNRPPNFDWTYTVEAAIQPSPADEERLYRFGVGDPDVEPWYVVSYSYEPALNMLEPESEIIHGWISSATLAES
jgi:hypothetical protein